MLNSMRSIFRYYYAWFSAFLALLLLLFSLSGIASATTFPPETGSSSVGLEGTVNGPPPSQAASIATPVNGTTISSIPETVNGLCPSGLLIKIFSNNVFVGSTMCTSGSYSIEVDLFGGLNELVAIDYDALNQAGPDSNTVSVTFNDAQLIEFGNVISLTSAYAERGSNPGAELDWPIILSGGTGPYALSVNWGDGLPAELLSESFPGNVTIDHTYKSSGVYNVIIQGTDSKGTEAYLQVVAVADGAILSNTSTGTKNTTSQVSVTKVAWWPAAVMVPLIVATFWVGRRHELYTLRREIEKSRQQGK
jgi:hypothetical protein